MCYHGSILHVSDFTHALFGFSCDHIPLSIVGNLDKPQNILIQLSKVTGIDFQASAEKEAKKPRSIGFLCVDAMNSVPRINKHKCLFTLHSIIKLAKDILLVTIKSFITQYLYVDKVLPFVGVINFRF